MRFRFSNEHAEFLESTFHVDPAADMTVDEQLDLEDKLSEHLQKHGVNTAGDGENAIGRICADILNFIAEND